MLTNVRKFDVRNLSRYAHYKVVDKHETTTTVSHPIPYTTGYASYGNKKAVLPEYLKGFEECYKEGYYSLRLKPEYYGKNRPKYTIEVKHTLYDVELTELGREYASERRDYYQRLANEYAHLLGE